MQAVPKTATYKLAVNMFADMSPQEFKAKYLGRRGPASPETAEVHQVGQRVVPDSIDWVTKGAVTPVKNQAQCGSCWAFSTTGALEGLDFIHSGNLISMSEQQLMDCSWVQGNQGCNGGLQELAFKYVVKAGGIDRESDYPYTGRSSYNCRAKKYHSIFRITGYRSVPKTNSGLKSAIAQQPVAVSIDALSIMNYHSGIFNDHSCGTELDHAVLGVGYGADGSHLYWKIKNSWSAAWGEKGYIRFERQEDQNTGICGILLDNSYPIA